MQLSFTRCLSFLCALTAPILASPPSVRPSTIFLEPLRLNGTVGSSERRLGASDQFQHFFKLVDESDAVKATIDELIGWAKREVDSSAGNIRANLERQGKLNWRFNLMWPGAGYSSIACGGQFEVLSLLARQGITDGIGSIMGTSGGATSAILALADVTGSSRSLLMYYHVMELYKRTTRDNEIWSQGEYLKHLYEHAIADIDSFENVKSKYWTTAQCRKGWWSYAHTGFNNCKTRRQCSQATFASGDVSIHGFIVGNRIDGMHKAGKCHDGGRVSRIPYGPDASLAQIFYDNNYGFKHATSISKASIQELFKKGVKDTIAMLRSDDLANREGQKVRSHIQYENVNAGQCTTWFDMASKKKGSSGC